MKALLTLMLCWCFLPLMAQEFTTYPNGLIYSPQAMKHINYVVDSLNLKFKKCEFNRKLITDLRGKGTYMRFELVDSTTLLLIESDLNKLLDTSLIINRYRKYIKRLENQAKFSFSYSPKLNQKPSYKIDVQVSSAQNKSIRRMSYSSENIPQRSLRSYFLNRQKVYGIKESTCILHIIWIDTIFPPRYLSNKYIHLVNFVDCMIDTTAKIFGRSGDLSKTKASGFLYKLYYDAIKATICPKISDFEQCIEQIRNDQKLLHKLDKRLKNDTTFLRSLRQAVIHSPYDDEYGSLELPDSNLNWLVERYAPLIMLDYIRQGAVVGECSHDDSPRIQAQKIAYLSAEAHNWGIFLRAHLNIMNDRFSRLSDGSYAWAQRQTYIQELEATGINVLDLIFGISLYVANPSPNHYYGNIHRLGRALAESKDSLEFERRAVSMITDADLDSLNRIRIAYLYTNYLLNLREKGRALPKWERFLQTANVPPAFLKSEGENIRKRLQE